MLRSLAAGLVSLTFVAAPALADPLTITGVGLSRDIACDGNDVSISGAENEITLTGTCGIVEVVGVDHKVTLEKADALGVAGSKIAVKGGEVSTLKVDTADNTVAVAIVAGKEAAQVVVAGSKQTIDLTLKTATTIHAIGADSQVLWTLADGAPAPKVNATGVKLRIQRKRG